MTAAVYRNGTPSLSLPQTQNTAPVLEFNCLYTHDIRRKQKRWRDGFVRYHTFNRRIMVYDIPRNFIGDTHWKADSDLQDGDEVVLEQGGVAVQVAESVGRSETDLTELRMSRKKGSSEKGSSSPVRGAQTPVARIVSGTGSRPTTQLKHRSLNALFGTPKGPIGKATLPAKSPFEQRHADAENEEWEDGRPPKRQRTEPPTAWNVTRTDKTAKSESKKEPPLWLRKADSTRQKKKAPLQAGQQKPGTKKIIDLSEDVEQYEKEKFLPGFFSDFLIPPSSPSREQASMQERPPVRSSSPAFQTQNFPENSRMRTSGKAKAMSTDAAPPVAEQHRARSRSDVINVDEQVDVMERLPERAVRPMVSRNQPRATAAATRTTFARREPAEDMGSPSSKSGKILRMTASAPKKKTLLCQDKLSGKPSRAYSTNPENVVDVLLEMTSSNAVSAKQGARSQRRKFEERLVRIGKKNDWGQEPENVVDDESAFIGRRKPSAERSDAGHDFRPQTHLEENALELARLDQMMMPVETPRDLSPKAMPLREERQLRRVLSESSKQPSARLKRAPGAPVRYTPSPAKKSPTLTTVAKSAGLSSNDASPPKPTTSLPPKSRTKKPVQRAMSLDTASHGTSTVMLSKPFQTPKPPETKAAEPLKTADPWSREAFDLFEWRPPGWDEGKWCLKDGGAVGIST